MPGDVQAIMDAAEEAAASNDYSSAARLLREAAALQESRLGPSHPDLANTLNNLGVMYERVGDIDESERSFRRAYAIATIALPLDHPFVATSRENLEEFCRLHGRVFDPEDDFRSESEPLEEPSRSEEQDALADHVVTDEPRVTTHHDPVPVDQAYSALRSSSAIDPPERAIPISALAGAVIGIVLVVGWMAWPSGTASDPPRTETRETTPPAASTVPEPAKPAPPTPSVDPTTPPVDPTPAPPPSTPVAEPLAAVDSPTVADARLCRTLTTSGEWQCDAVSGDVAPGPIYFFTRIVAERPTTVQHRWYVGDQLRQTVMLSIQPNGAGYRTYSRTTIAPERAGEWRVELRSEDGRLLREQRFTVR